jgi:hypothetical protein
MIYETLLSKVGDELKCSERVGVTLVAKPTISLDTKRTELRRRNRGQYTVYGGAAGMLLHVNEISQWEN